MIDFKNVQTDPHPKLTKISKTNAEDKILT